MIPSLWTFEEAATATEEHTLGRSGVAPARAADRHSRQRHGRARRAVRVDATRARASGTRSATARGHDGVRRRRCRKRAVRRARRACRHHGGARQRPASRDDRARRGLRRAGAAHGPPAHCEGRHANRHDVVASRPRRLLVPGRHGSSARRADRDRAFGSTQLERSEPRRRPFGSGPNRRRRCPSGAGRGGVRCELSRRRARRCCARARSYLRAARRQSGRRRSCRPAPRCATRRIWPAPRCVPCGPMPS